MPAGGPGDEPLIDILRWRRPVYSLAADTLIAELVELGGEQSAQGVLDSFGALPTQPTRDDLTAIEASLAAKRDELLRHAEESGWDMESMASRIETQRRAVALAWTDDRP
jgi:hypothetical protein